MSSSVVYFAETDFRGQRRPFGIRPEDRARHMYVIGKTGMGKSTLLENMAIQDIKNGEGICFIDPHGKTAELLLDYVPEERLKDVVYFAPFDLDHPVAFNVMEDVGKDQRHLVANGLMATFKKIWPDVWSGRMEYILNNTILALLEYPDSTLLGVNRMLSEKNFRQKVVDNISDPTVKAFWTEEFAKYSEKYMQEAGDAIKNKIGQFTGNPLIRNIIGQPKSSFDIRQLMDNKKIFIVNLSKGRVGEINANLLGGMVITKIYLAAMSRAHLHESEVKKLPPFYLFVDEFQSFVNESFSDILSEARKYKLALTIAHQYIEQMPEEVREAVFGNVGSIICFRVGPLDAELLEKIFAPVFMVQDIVNLGFAQIYLTLMVDGVGSQPFSAVTMKPIPTLPASNRNTIIGLSREAFAHPRAEIEALIAKWHEPVGAPIKPSLPPTSYAKASEVKKAPMAQPTPKSPPAAPKPPIMAPVAPKVAPTPVPPPVAPVSYAKASEAKKAPVSLDALKPAVKDTGKNSGALRDALAAAMVNQPKAKPESAKPASTNDPVKAVENKAEVPEDVLRNLLNVKTPNAGH